MRCLLLNIIFFYGGINLIFGQVPLEGKWIFEKSELREYSFNSNIMELNILVGSQEELNLDQPPFHKTIVEMSFSNDNFVRIQRLAMPEFVGSYNKIRNNISFLSSCLDCPNGIQNNEQLDFRVEHNSEGNLQLIEEYFSSSPNGPVRCEYIITFKRPQ